jgi:hypothetical protein
VAGALSRRRTAVEGGAKLGVGAVAGVTVTIINDRRLGGGEGMCGGKRRWSCAPLTHATGL